MTFKEKLVIAIITLVLVAIVVLGVNFGMAQQNACYEKGGWPIFEKRFICTKGCFYTKVMVGCTIN